MTTIGQTGFQGLEAAGRLINAAVKEASTKPGRFVFRGELIVEFGEASGDSKKLPKLLAQQVIAASDEGSSTLSFFAGYLLSLEGLKPMHDVLVDTLTPQGTYFAFCSNVDLDDAFEIALGDATWKVLPLDESSVYAELLDLLGLEKSDLKKRSAAGKLDAIVDGMKTFKGKFEAVSYGQALERMGEAFDPTAKGPV